MSQIKKVEVARIVKPHGLKGELKINPITDDFEAFKRYNYFFIDNKEYEVEYFKSLNHLLIVKFKNINQIEEVKPLSSHWLEVDRDQLIDSSPLIDDYIGLEAIDEKNERKIGEITGYYDGGGSGLFELKTEKGNKLIPCLKEYWISPDFEKGTVYFRDQDNLLNF